MNERVCIIIFLILVLVVILLNSGYINKKEKFIQIPAEEYQITTQKNKNNDNLIPIKPAILDTRSNLNSSYLPVSDINGYSVGDRIVINHGCQNQEVKKIYNVANNLLYTDSELNNIHYPGEPIRNIDNPDFNTTEMKCINPEEMKYAYLDESSNIEYSKAWS